MLSQLKHLSNQDIERRFQKAAANTLYRFPRVQPDQNDLLDCDPIPQHYDLYSQNRVKKNSSIQPVYSQSRPVIDKLTFIRRKKLLGTGEKYKQNQQHNHATTTRNSAKQKEVLQRIGGRSALKELQQILGEGGKKDRQEKGKGQFSKTCQISFRDNGNNNIIGNGNTEKSSRFRVIDFSMTARLQSNSTALGVEGSFAEVLERSGLPR